jgi:hypothetical protein
MEDKIEPRVLAYLRPAPEPEFAAELCVMDKDGYYTVICMSDQALLNMAQKATALMAERNFFKGEDDE